MPRNSLTILVTSTLLSDPPAEELIAVPVGDPADLPRVTAEEAARAKESLSADETFGALTADTNWMVVEEVLNTRDDEKIGVALIVKLDKPTTSAGPWRQFRCQGTVIHEYRLTYRDISLLGAVFNSDGSALLALSPLAASSDQPLEFDTDADIATPICPEGSEEDKGY